MAALAPVSVPASVPANVSSIGSPFSPYAPSGLFASPTSPSEQDLTTPKAESSLFGSQGKFARRAKGSVSSAHATPPCTDAVSPPRPPPKGPALSPNGLIQHIDQLSRRPTLLGTPPRSASLSSRTQTPTEIAPWNFSNDVGASLEPLVTPAHAPSMQQTPTDSRARALPPPTPTSSTKNGGSPATKEKKSRGFMSLLKRKTSKSELRTAPSPSESDFAASVPAPAFSSLPAKLQARGDTADMLPANMSTKNAKVVKRVKKPMSAAPSVVPRTGTPVGRSGTSIGRSGSTDPGLISLDTNFDSMEGIVNLGASSINSRDPSLIDGLDGTDRPGGLKPRPPSTASPSSSRRPSLANFNRRTSLDPAGGLSFPNQVDAALLRGRQASAVAGFWTANNAAVPHDHEMSPLTRAVPGSRLSFSFPQTHAVNLDGFGITMSGTSTPGVPLPPAPLSAGIGAAAWTAPDSWAVKGEAGAMEHDSSTDENSNDEEAEEDTIESETGTDPVLDPVDEAEVARPGTAMSVGGSRNALLTRPTTSASRMAGKSGRPGTADGLGRQQGFKTFNIRIFRPDGTFTTLPVVLGVTTTELTTTVSKKFQIQNKLGYALYLREKGIERRMGPNEKPVLLQKRRFEQAGYTELDKLDDLGREDNSYLCKLVYKPQHANEANLEDDIGESLEFVDMSGRKVETIPIFLYRHAHEIVSLNLSKNRPFELPTDFVQLCTSLRELVLSNMGIKRIPQAVKECVSLTRLDISNNHIVELEHIALDELSELTSLKCHNNRLWQLPEYFSRFKQLKYLNLSNNRFEAMPIVVCEVVALVELDVSFNTITTVPAEIGQLRSLERLVLLANMITFLPPTFNTLVHLKELDCRRNSIADLSAICDVESLEVLGCDYNQASVLDANWAHMRVLNASNNSLTRFALYGTSNTLTSLNLSFGKISSLATDMFEHLGSVENLILDSNQIRVLPEGVGSLSNLVHLSIKNNLLDELPATIGKLQRLQMLSISGNNLPALPTQIWLCSQLTVLNASSNLLHDFPDPPLTSAAVEPGLEELDTRKPATVSKAPSTANGRIAPPLALSLQKLYLGDNRLTDDVFAPISLMTEVRILNLSFNELYEIPPSSLFKCQQLEELYLSGNKLTSLPPEDLERLVNLKIIYVNGNRLQTLPAELGKIRKLFALDVGSNVLKYNIANWPYDWNWNWNLELRYLNLSGNKRLEIKPGHQNEPTMPRNVNNQKRRNLADFSALTKLHVLGLMDLTLMIPSLPDESEDRRVRTSSSEINAMGYGIADTLGSRVDTLSLVDVVVHRFRGKEDEALFGLFDAVNKGQNTGARLVKYLQTSFDAVLTLELSRLKSGEQTTDALRRAFLGINRDYGNSLLPGLESRRKDSEVSLTDRSSASLRTGAAGVIVYIRKKKMYVANAGNSLAVVAGRGGTARLITKKHEPFDAAEIARIRTAEGWISHRGYVNDEVDVSRAFGFYNVFPAINVSPNVEEIELADTDEFVIIANRGLWEHMSYQAAVDVARTERSSPMIAAAKLRDLAISYGSAQNIMVMVLAVGDLFKVQRDYRSHRMPALGNDEGFYGVHKSGAAMRREKGEGAGERYLNLLDREVAPPVGSLALVFTDIRNSTALWESNPGMQTGIRMHNQLLRRQLRAIGGYEVKTEGDAFMVSFPTVTAALLWCLTVQIELLREEWPQEILDSEEGKEILNSSGNTLYRGLSVRMGIHWGSPVCEADPITRRMDYFGPMVNRSARISAVAEGGQISASQDVIDIIQEVVMESKPEASSSDSDAGEEEEEVWLDPNEKHDVLALRRLGFGISELGERRLKGLETPEMISLIWPKVLKERVKLAGIKDESAVPDAEVYDPSTQLLDVTLVGGIGRACQRLEAAVAAIVHPERWEDTRLALSPKPGQLTLAKRRLVVHPAALALPLRQDATDVELAAVLEVYINRIENVLSTMVLHQLSGYTEVLAALGGAIKVDPRYLASALAKFGRLMQD